MIPERDPESLVRAMAEEEVPSEPKELLQARRERTVAALSRAIRQSGIERERRGRIRRRLASIAAAAALVAAGVGGHFLYDHHRVAEVAPSASVGTIESVNGTLVVTHAGRPRVVSSGEHPLLIAGDELRTAADGGAKLKTERSAIEVAPATQVSVLAPSAAEERIRLAVGRIDLHVTKHAKAPRSVVVETPNADVVVRGTVFSVAVRDDAGVKNTRVRVTEGSVWVLSGGVRDLVSTGEEWSSLAPRHAASSQPAAKPEVAAAASAPAPTPESAKPKSPSRSGKAAPVVRESSTLLEENKMFQAAVDARNRGDDRRAIELFGSLLGRYPKSRLAEEARVERMRALRRLGDTARASAEARRYLSEHGSGFAREEARDAALGGK